MKDYKKLDQNYVANTYGRFDLLIEKGDGAYFFDEAGKGYIDLGSGIAVNSVGANDAAWREAIIEQLGKIQHTSNLYYTKPQIELAELLCNKTGMGKVFFTNSGAEANEGLIKAARKYSSDKYGAGRHKIITLLQSFHGRTMATLSATGQEAMHHDFGPFLEGFVHVAANDLEAVKAELAAGDVCAVMIELIQGEGGVNVLDMEYVQALEQLCTEQDVLLCVDEVQTGNGRTGALYCYQNYGIKPNIVSTAKGLAGGLPMGAILFDEKTQGVLGAGDHGSTYGGNPICAAAALSVIGRMDEEFLSAVKEKGDYIMQQLEGAAGVENVSGLGLMVGVKTVRPIGEVLEDCMDAGVLVLTAKDKIRLLPSLTIDFDTLKTAIAILKEVLAK